MYARLRSTWRRMVLALVVCSYWLAPSLARAVDRWTAPYPGVRVLHRFGDGVDYWVVLVDLTNPQVSLVATRPEDRFITTSEFARRYEAQVALNANFFNRSSCGLAVGSGEAMSGYDDNCRASIGIGRGNEVAVFDSLLIPSGPAPAAWMTEVWSGKPFLMREGRALTNWVRPQHLYRPNPRSAIGVTGDRRTLVMLAADGRRRGVPGLTGFQMVRVFQEFGVTDAINLDGGGSTTLVLGGRQVNRPSDGTQRNVVSHIGVRVRPDAVWYGAEITGQGAPARVRQDASARVWLEVRNLGRVTWQPEGAGTSSPVLELDDGVVSYVARVAEATAPGEVGRFEIHWLARGAGMRHLRARLIAPDGTALASRPLTWDVRVERAPHARPPRPQRIVATGRASEVMLPAGLGALFFGTRGCAVGTRSAGPGVWLGLGALAALGACARRRRMR